MNTKIILLTILVISVILGISQYFLFQPTTNPITSFEMEKLDIKSLFDVYGINQEYFMENGQRHWTNMKFELNSEFDEIYDDLKYDSQEKTVVIYPILTESAYYDEHGYYLFYNGECDEKCLTVKIVKDNNQSLFNSSGIGFQILKLLGYETITDVELDQNPQILKKYDKVILLHNEYVTKKEFDAITNHPKVIYLYPNALYTEVEIDYWENSVSLVRGHNYPEQSILNGFEWKFDNSELEYDVDCMDMEFYGVENGFMLNCYPELIIHKNQYLLKTIKEL